MKYRTTRRVQKVGGSSYVPIPRLAMLSLRLFIGDWVEYELDDETHVLTMRPVNFRSVVPTLRLRTNDMAPERAVVPYVPASAGAAREQLELEEPAS